VGIKVCMRVYLYVCECACVRVRVCAHTYLLTSACASVALFRLRFLGFRPLVVRGGGGMGGGGGGGNGEFVRRLTCASVFAYVCMCVFSFRCMVQHTTCAPLYAGR
jgi:hypothetical protein